MPVNDLYPEFAEDGNNPIDVLKRIRVGLLDVGGGLPNSNIKVLPLDTYTDDIDSQSVANAHYRGGHFIIVVETLTGGDTVTITIQAYDEASDVWYPLLIGPELNSPGTTVLKIYPGITSSPNAAASDILPGEFRCSCVVVGSAKFTTDANLIV